MPPLRILLAAALLAAPSTGRAVAAEPVYDVVVYGGTSGGVAAAIQAARMGKSAVLVEPGKHLGGLSSGGLGATDIGNKKAIGGIAREFYQRVFQHYSQPGAWKQERRVEYQSRRQQAGEDTMWTFEPHVAEAIFAAMIGEAGVTVVLGERLDLNAGVEKDGARITKIKMESGRELAGRMFIDASYEGDLMAKAGVSYTVGREANSQYNETLNGVQIKNALKHQFVVGVDPYVVRGDPKSGLLHGVHGGSPGRQGEADHRVQAYNYRMCTTDVADNSVDWPKPADYDALRYELLLRNFEAGDLRVPWNPVLMPNRKTDTNNNFAISTDNIGMNYDYPDGDYATREKIIAEHVSYQQGLMWTLANDPRVPGEVRKHFQTWRLAKDEFADNGHWPHQLYVREARRMVSDYVMTEHNCQGDALAPDGVGLAAYGMDSHNTQRYVDEQGYARNEGDVQVHGFSPYPIAYQSVVPKRQQCTNLLVPVCMSATHIAYGSIRMEPVFMVLGQSTATAACQAIDQRAAVQDIDRARLRERLLGDGQVLEWTGPRPYRGKQPDKLAGIVVDDSEAEIVGAWSSSRSSPGYVGTSYLHDGREGQGQKHVRFEAAVPASGRYEVRLAYTANSNRATNVAVTVEAADGRHTLKVNQRRTPPIDETFVSLGTFRFAAGKAAVVVVSNQGADGYVVADAVQLVPAAP